MIPQHLNAFVLNLAVNFEPPLYYQYHRFDRSEGSETHIPRSAPSTHLPKDVSIPWEIRRNLVKVGIETC